jgi:hypothetical protein
MKIKSKIEGMDEWLFIEELPDAYSAVRQLSEKHISIKKEPVKKLLCYQISSGGMFLMHANMQFNEPVRILSDIEGETVTSQFIFYEGGDMSLKIPHQKKASIAATVTISGISLRQKESMKWYPMWSTVIF